MDRKRSGPWQILACTTLDTALTSGRDSLRYRRRPFGPSRDGAHEQGQSDDKPQTAQTRRTCGAQMLKTPRTITGAVGEDRHHCSANVAIKGASAGWPPPGAGRRPLCAPSNPRCPPWRPEIFPDEGAIGTPTLLLPAEA